MISCKICKNLSKMVVESDENGNIIRYKPNTCKLTKQEIYDVRNSCFVEGKC